MNECEKKMKCNADKGRLIGNHIIHVNLLVFISSEKRQISYLWDTCQQSTRTSE